MAELLRPLIEAARNGDRDALNRLAGCVDRFVRIFSGTLSRQMRKGYGSTIDFVLEGLAEALSRLDRFEYRSDEQFYGWISSCIRSRIVDVARREGRAKRAERPGFLDEQALAVEAADPRPSTRIAAGELRERLGRAIVDVQVDHPQEMEAVILKVYDEQSWPAIREQMNLSSDRRARTLFAHGMAHLQGRLENELGGAVLDDLLKS